MSPSCLLENGAERGIVAPLRSVRPEVRLVVTATYAQDSSRSATTSKKVIDYVLTDPLTRPTFKAMSKHDRSPSEVDMHCRTLKRLVHGTHRLVAIGAPAGTVRRAAETIERIAALLAHAAGGAGGGHP